MKRTQIFIIICTCLSVACSTVPKELLDAREAYTHASEGPASKKAPVELRQAQEALFKAEQAYALDEKPFKVKDLSYIAKRKAQLSEVRASAAVSKEEAKQAIAEFGSTQGHLLQKTKAQREEEREKFNRMLAEKDEALSNMRDDLDKLAMANKLAGAQVSTESRGVVITLSGSVLFSSASATLLNTAQSRLKEVAHALMEQKERKLLIEGHTDSQGSDAYNLDLSQKRAESVRSFLVSQGYPADKIDAKGMGETRPIADNGSPEGRANNRRVEIIVQSNE